jgi:dimethylargininase
MISPCFEFSRAITRTPAASVVNGLSAEDRGTPQLAQMLKDHEAYITTLRETGASVTVLPPLEDYPDAVFVEDTALCLPACAILMRPGAPSRQGEVMHMAATLKAHYENVFEITEPGHIEGGDILMTSREILVGKSARTDAHGVRQLKELVKPYGYRVRELQTPPDVLHFKTDCSLLDNDTVLSTHRLAASRCFEGYRVLYTAKGEEAAANAIRFNEFVIMPAGFPQTAALLRDNDYNVREINNSECAKIDGGMSCLSLRF